jgi:hypothetical protein
MHPAAKIKMQQATGNRPQMTKKMHFRMQV